MASKNREFVSVNHWELIAEILKEAGWSLGWVSAVDSEGRTIWIADAHRGDGKRYAVRAGEKLTSISSARCNRALVVARTAIDALPMWSTSR
jgi:hypothetical protein